MAKKLTKAEIAKNPTKAINSGKMQKKSGEIIGPGKIAAKLAAKVAGKSTVKSGVKILPRKTAPKSGLEGRGLRPSRTERINRARDLQFDKAEKEYDAIQEMAYTGTRRKSGLVSSNKGLVPLRGAGKKNARKIEAIKREARKSLPIQINSARPFNNSNSGNLFRGKDILKSNNARGLKAANKPTRASKNKELAMVKKLTEANKGLKMTERGARTDAMRTVDRIYNSKLRSKSSRKIFKKKSK